MPERDLMLVFSNPVDGQDGPYNEWYDQIHLAEVLAVPGVISAQRYALAPVEILDTEEHPAPPPPAHRYLALYELDGEPGEIMAECGRRMVSGEMSMHESLDPGSLSTAIWRARGPRRTAG